MATSPVCSSTGRVWPTTPSGEAALINQPFPARATVADRTMVRQVVLPAGANTIRAPSPHYWASWRVSAARTPRLGAPLQTGLRQQPRHVVLHGLLGQVSPLGDLAVGQAFPHQVQDSALGVGQRGEPGVGGEPGGTRAATLRAGFPVLSAPPPSVAALARSEARWEARGQVKCPDQGHPKVQPARHGPSPRRPPRGPVAADSQRTRARSRPSRPTAGVQTRPATAATFEATAGWEEQMLRERPPNYAAYGCTGSARVAPPRLARRLR